jgi:hypothetical protein
MAMENQFIGPVVGSLTALIGLYAGFAKLKSDFKKEIELEKSKDLDLLNSKIVSVKREIEDKVESEVKNARTIAEGDSRAADLKLDAILKDISNLEERVDKDIKHLKAIYNSEIKQLAEKVESLREDVQKQHQQLVGLLTKLITSNNE